MKKRKNIIIFILIFISFMYVFYVKNNTFQSNEISNDNKYEQSLVKENVNKNVESSSSDLCPIDTYLNTVYAYDYTGGEQTFTAPINGIYKIEVWGAAGGAGLQNGSVTTGIGGYGGYAIGEIYLHENEVLYINVGGKGSNGVVKTNVSGGYNGGGSGSWDNNDDESSGGGGGATHIATKSGLLSSLSSYKSSIIIVAGGGGGGSYVYAAGSGGGYIGGITSYTNQSVVSQTTGYSFGKGQNGSGVADSDGVGGGGGGYYGGYMNNVSYKSAGSGGSGYIGNTSLKEKVMYCYSCTASNETSTKTVSTTCTSSTATSNCAKQGNGYAKITLIGI